MTDLERTFLTYWLQLGDRDNEPAQEYQFHPTRKWRFDFAWPDAKVACELEGIVSEKSRHTTITGYTKDCDKYNQAALCGWTVLRFTVLHMNDPFAVIEQVQQALQAKETHP